MENSEINKIRQQFLFECGSSTVAMETELANSQHYELPTMFYENILVGK